MSRTMLAAILLGLAVPLTGTTVLDEPSTAPAATPQVWLSGAFGRVPGADPTAPASAAPHGAALDAWIRRAPLTLHIDVAPEDVLGVEVVSTPLDSDDVPLDGDDVEERLSSGVTQFTGPDTPGVSIVTATVTTEAHGRTRHAWLLQVPDRTGGEEALLDIPGPQALLVGSAGDVAGEPGNGCYVYLCVDVGYQPPASSLEALPVRVGETLSLRLDDGSAMTGWTGSLTPIADTAAKAREAGDEFPNGPVAVVGLAGLEPVVAGEWLLQVRADYDRERGWQWFLYRLAVE